MERNLDHEFQAPADRKLELQKPIYQHLPSKRDPQEAGETSRRWYWILLGFCRWPKHRGNLSRKRYDQRAVSLGPSLGRKQWTSSPHPALSLPDSFLTCIPQVSSLYSSTGLLCLHPSHCALCKLKARPFHVPVRTSAHHQSHTGLLCLSSNISMAITPVRAFALLFPSPRTVSLPRQL